MFEENWIDVDEDLGLDGIPELPPLQFEPAFSAPVSPEKSATQETEISSAAGSAVEVDNSPKANSGVARSSRFRFKNTKETTTYNQPNQPKVCFIGNFAPGATLEDFRQFLDLKGIQTTEIRLGPRKKLRVSFGYCDLATEADFQKLLAEDGTMYLGRKIRIDQATPHAKKPIRGGKYFGSKSLRPPRPGSLRRTSSAPLPNRKQQFRPSHPADRRGNNRFLMNRGKAGTRNYKKRTPNRNARRTSRETTGPNSPTTTNTSSFTSRFSNYQGSRSRFGRRS